MVAIRPAERSDVERVRRVARRAWQAAHVPIVGQERVEQFLGEHYDRESFLDRVDGEAALLVAEDDAVVGYTLVTVEDRVAHLAHVYVDPDRWGEGVGGRLLSAAERVARERDCERIDLGVMAENDRAVGFYEANGYDRVDEGYDDRIDTRYYTYEKRL